MIESLLEESFNKAGILCEKETLHARSIFLAELLTEEYMCSITDKSLRRYYKKESSPKKAVLDAMAQFLEFRDYEDYVKKRNPEILKPSATLRSELDNSISKEKKRRPGRRIKGALFLFLGLILGTGGYHGFIKSSPDCIRWTGEQYVAAICSGDALDIPYRQDLLDDFRQVRVSDTTQFFSSGKPQIWYLKTSNQLEYFSAPGLHPISGETLRPITPYMIDKYVLAR